LKMFTGAVIARVGVGGGKEGLLWRFPNARERKREREREREGGEVCVCE